MGRSLLGCRWRASCCEKGLAPVLLDEVGCCWLLFVICCFPLRTLLGACLGAAARKGASLGLSQNESCRAWTVAAKGFCVLCFARWWFRAPRSFLGGDAAALDSSFGFPPRMPPNHPFSFSARGGVFDASLSRNQPYRFFPDK